MIKSQFRLLFGFGITCLLSGQMASQAAPPSPAHKLANLNTVKEGSIRLGGEKSADILIYDDGTIEAYFPPEDFLVAKPAERRLRKLSPQKISELKRLIEQTNFDALQLDTLTRRPSEHDSCDVVLECLKADKKIVVPLWQLNASGHKIVSPVITLMQKYKMDAFNLKPKSY